MSNRPETLATWTREQLAEQLRRQCGIRSGQILIAHSSLSSLGQVAGGAAAVVGALQDALTPEGTLLMPVFSHPTADRIWRMGQTPSRTGAITEAFRTAPGVVRSFNATHSVAAWGKRAAEFTAGHEKTSPLGPDSPFHIAAKAGAEVMMIGCSLKSCSLVHVSEAILRVPYLGKVCYGGYEKPIQAFAADGRQLEFKNTDMPTDSAGFLALQAELDRRGKIQHVQLGSAECLKFSGAVCLEVAVEMLRQDPGALLCDNTECPVCVPAKGILAKG
jgi:aminoglycoside 3-N-acetyltransferase